MAMGDKRQDASIECPYYVSCKGKSITCKGGLDEKGKTVSNFRTESKRKEFMGNFCQKYYALCHLVKSNDHALGFDRPDERQPRRRTE